MRISIWTLNPKPKSTFSCIFRQATGWACCSWSSSAPAPLLDAICLVGLGGGIGVSRYPTLSNPFKGLYAWCKAESLLEDLPPRPLQKAQPFCRNHPAILEKSTWGFGDTEATSCSARPEGAGSRRSQLEFGPYISPLITRPIERNSL